MKKLVICLAMLMMVFGFFNLGYSATKYDVIMKNDDFKKVLIIFNNAANGNEIVHDYINEVVNMNDLNRIVISGSMTDKEKAKFISENKEKFLIYMQGFILKNIVLKINPTPTDAQIIYITSVIRTHSKGGSIMGVKSKIGPNAEAKDMVEKQLFEGSALYRVCQDIRKPGALEAFSSEQIDVLYNIITKKGKKSK